MNPAEGIEIEYTPEDLKNQKHIQLKYIAKAKNIMIPRASTKAQIIQLILTHQARNKNAIIQDAVLLPTTFKMMTNSEG